MDGVSSETGGRPHSDNAKSGHAVVSMTVAAAQNRMLLIVSSFWFASVAISPYTCK